MTTTLALLMLAALGAGDGTPDVYAPTEAPLDERIDAAKVTEHDPPPLPEQVILPVPPEFRVAASADDVPLDPARFERAVTALRAGLAWLAAAQDADGAWMADTEAAPTDEPDKQSPIAVAVTALAVKAFVQAGDRAPRGARLGPAMRYIRRAQRDDGAFEGGALTNYVTSSVVMALASLDAEDFADELADATGWLEISQWDQGEGLGPRQDWFGGAGYGGRGRPDVSNTQTMLDALYEAGRSPDEPSVQRALSFISRAQNLKATNGAAWAGNDGGFVYTPANGGESMASEAAGEGRYGELIAAGTPRSLRSYGSMTYAGFKSMLYAGLSPDDLRVRAAYDWIRNNWTFDENPGLGRQGLYYYYHTMARALRAGQQDEIEDVDGVVHNWRAELIDALADRQKPDGRWQNDADRWLEGEPALATIYAVLALEEAIKPVTPRPRAEGLRFEVTYDPAIADSFTGRVYVMLSESDRFEPRLGPSWFHTEPFFALDVEGWTPDRPLVLDDEALGYPGPLSRLPAGEYAVQAVMRINRDSPFIGRGPGTAYSPVVHDALAAGGAGVPVTLHINQVVEPNPPRELDRTTIVEFRSDLLSEFHGRDVIMRAAVVVPDGYDDDEETTYPTLYVIPGFGGGHLSGLAMMGRMRRLEDDRLVLIGLSGRWVTGHHVYADSENNGPWGEALVTELIPHLERTFRLAAEPEGRFLTGASSGGWASLWLQITYPDFFGGTWSLVPDPVDFRSFQRINLYEPGVNMFVDEDGNRRPIARRRGEVALWYDDFARMEHVWGEGGQLYSFDACFSPRGADGRPRLIFDRLTGEVDPQVAESWKRYDIRLILEENWPTLGPKLAGKLRVFAGEQDNFYLEEAVGLLGESLDRLGSDAVVEILPGRTHGSVLDQAMLERIHREALAAYDGARVHAGD